jgi:hypothetical protein
MAHSTRSRLSSIREARSWKKIIDGLKSEKQALEEELATLKGVLLEKEAQISVLKEVLVSSGN